VTGGSWAQCRRDELHQLGARFAHACDRNGHDLGVACRGEPELGLQGQIVVLGGGIDLAAEGDRRRLIAVVDELRSSTSCAASAIWSLQRLDSSSTKNSSLLAKLE
jgi:hypothetical protein